MKSSNDQLKFEDVLTIVRRRKWQAGIPAAAILLLSIALAFLLPPVYVSTSTILIEQQEIPTDLVASTVTAYAAERVEKIRLRVMTTDNLWAIVEKRDLYPDRRSVEEEADIVSQMRQDVTTEMVVSEAVDPRSGRTITPTIAFTLSYSNESPAKAQAVTSDLTQLFLDEDRRSRTENAQQAASFLKDEAQRLQDQISDLESKIATFKVQNAGNLPDARASTSSLLETSQRELELLDAKLAPLESRHAFLQSQLSGFGAAAQLAKARGELSAARERFSEIHPDVIRLKQQIADLEAEIKQSGGNAIYGAASADPAYLEMQGEMQRVAGEIGAIRSQRSVLNQKIAAYQTRLAQSPEVEREYAALTRDLERATTNYRDIMNKVSSAQLAEELERTQRGERLTLIGAASFPTAPAKPNRPAIILLGLTFALGAGLSIAALAEYLDHRIHGPRDLAAVFKAPPLAIIPEIRG